MHIIKPPLRPREVARLYRIRSTTVYQAIKCGCLPADQRVGENGRVRFWIQADDAATWAKNNFCCMAAVDVTSRIAVSRTCTGMVDG
jgi:hypothetical protein